MGNGHDQKDDDVPRGEKENSELLSRSHYQMIFYVRDNVVITQRYIYIVSRTLCDNMR